MHPAGAMDMLQRMSNTLNSPTSDDLAQLTALADGQAVHGADEVAPYLVDPRGLTPGNAATVLKPETTERVSQIVRYCADRRIGIVPYGGGTGLVGGQVAPADPMPVLLSLERMNRIRSVSVSEGAILAEAGVILSDIQHAADEVGKLFPLSLASEGSCRIGGNLSTNAGGVQVLRYGNARDLCLGIEAVMPNGEILNGLKTLRKDNTGYDLRHLLLGAEGTLGIITAAALRLFPKPGATVTAMLAIPGHAAAVDLLRHLQDALGDSITAFELIHGTGIEFVETYFPETVDPLADPPEWRVLTEVIGPDAESLSERVEAALGEAFEAGLATDGVIASSEAQRQNMWWIRETIPECNRKVGAVGSHDISIPISRLSKFVDAGLEKLAAIDPVLRLNCFGHIGDGNLHLNILKPEGMAKEEFFDKCQQVNKWVFDIVQRHRGSVSAEHGVGLVKKDYLQYTRSPVEIEYLRGIKRVFDPNGIMNPGKIFDIGG